MIIRELRVISCELVFTLIVRVASCELRVASCELRVASCELVFHHINSIILFQFLILAKGSHEFLR